MRPELTHKDGNILDFLNQFGVCRKEHLSCFVGYNIKNLYRLQQNNKIVIEDECIKIKAIQIENAEQENVLKVLDILQILYQDKKITKDIISVDLPYYAAAKLAEVEIFMYFTIVNKGRENIQCRLIDRENYGNFVLILESEDQIDKIKLNTLADKVFIYENEVKKR
ncbi:hypothetical protein HZI73_26155 (plasmid) [Vallitalea pronyensis]|uniref:Uncharacterized protein n=1 Tax=Vallitalea pronyensis TaxID=1348613 RepID=A0A8J8MR14_9FIRM|nr:hypothetical protein [Vallitalea pronyensis]QUI25898.1 hypothetical protein HZI73_26155 [Vallitalea pronyensis]